jgi:hypothetical protein
MQEVAQNNGLPAGTLNANIIGNMIAGGLSPSTFATRVAAGWTAYNQADPTIKAALQKYYGLTPAQMVHFILDPKTATTLIQSQMAAGVVGGAVKSAGLQDINKQQAEQFANFGQTHNVDVTKNIQQAGTMAGLMGTAPGQAREGLTQDQLLQGAVGTSTAAQQTLAGAQQAQAAPLKAGGGDVANQKGVVGAGYAATE